MKDDANASREGLGLRAKPWDFGFTGVPGALPSWRGFALTEGPRAVRRDADDDRGDACQVTYLGTWPKAISPAVVAVAGS